MSNEFSMGIIIVGLLWLVFVVSWDIWIFGFLGWVVLCDYVEYVGEI